MKRIMLRVDDDLYTRIFETAHDQRLSMNEWIGRTLESCTNGQSVQVGTGFYEQLLADAGYKNGYKKW